MKEIPTIYIGEKGVVEELLINADTRLCICDVCGGGFTPAMALVRQRYLYYLNQISLQHVCIQKIKRHNI